MSTTVKLHVYDLSQGLAKVYAPMLLGMPLEGVWHSALVLHNKEVFYGQGISVADPGKTHLGRPTKVIDLGETELPWETVEEYLQEARQDWTAERYDLFRNNCNDFSDELAQFVTGKGIPTDVKSVAKTVAGTPFGQMLMAQMGAQGSRGAEFGAF